MKQLFEKYMLKGYHVHNKRVIGDLKHSSDEVKNRDALQEFALLQEWLRVEHGIWVSVNNAGTKTFSAGVYNVEGEWVWDDNLQEFQSPQEAYSNAFNYILNNLI